MTSVILDSGPIIGRTHDVPDSASVFYFGDVPYAQARRFGLPDRVEPWSATRDCTRPGPLPPQRTEGLELVPGMTVGETDEQCLTAEVWTPSTSGTRPILVWIPGGSFRVGGAALATYDGRRLAADGDMVVVGLNYRLGLLGFLNAPGVPSNLGLRDVLAALDWIRANAEAFGGDPQRIVLLGESAGAGAIYHLLTRPDLAAAGAIVFSGSPTMTQTSATAAHVAETVLRLAGVASAAGLAETSVETLLDIQAIAVNDLARTVGMMPFHPWVDGDVVPSSPLAAAAADRLTAIPLVIATTADEMELFRPMVPVLPRPHAVSLLGVKAAALGIDAAGVERGLGACDDDLVTAIADIDLQLPALLIAESHARRGLPVWRASFTWQSAAYRACHALDLPFHFGTFDVDEWSAFAALTSAFAALTVDDGSEREGVSRRQVAEKLSGQMRASWGAFARTGVPACEPIGDWPAFDGGSSVVELGEVVGVVRDAGFGRLRSWR